MPLRLKFPITALLAAFVLTSGSGFVFLHAAKAWGPLEAMLVRGVVRTISAKEAESRDRRNINQRRDAELAEVQLRVDALAVQERNGWISAEDAARERERYAALSAAIEERAKRERQVVSFQTRNRIREELKSAIPDAIKAASGADPRAVDFLMGVLQGEKPIEAAINAALSGSGSADPRDAFGDLEETLREVEKAAQGLRGAQGIAIRARVEQALREASGITIGEGEIPDDKLSRLKELESEIRSAIEQIGDIGRDLFPGSEGISRERFADNERWQQLDAAVQAQEGPLAGRTIISSMARNAINEAIRQAEEAGITLSPEQLDAIAASVTESWVNERLDPDYDQARGTTPVEDLVRSAINQGLATAGQDPLPDPRGKDTGEESGQPIEEGGGSSADTAQNDSTAGGEVPEGSSSGDEPKADVPGVPEEPTATTPPPTATTAPTLAFSGSITEGVAAGSVDSLTSTVNLTVNFATGAVSGSLSGSGGGNTTFPCSLPNGPTLDTAVVSYASSYEGSLTGTYDPATGAISGSMSVGGNVTGTLTQPFTHPECTHLNQGQIPGLGPWQGVGSFTGNATEIGVNLSTSWTAGSASAGGSTSLGP